MTTNNEHPIVVAIPTDDDLEAVLRYAVAEARIHNCGVRLVHAHESGDEGYAEVVLGRAQSVARLLAGPSVRIRTRRIAGLPVQSVLAASTDARLVVLRRRDSLNLRRVLADGGHPIGAERPIACVPPTWAPRVQDRRPVLLAVEDPADCASTLETGLRIARAHRTSLHVLHVWHLPGRCDEMVERQVGSGMTDSLRASLLAELERCRHQEEFRDVPVDLDVRHGTAAELVVQLARNAQVVAIGRNQPGPDGSVRLGRVARSLLYESPCPTLLLPSHRPAATKPRQLANSGKN